ncbi:putative dynein-related AAA-type ATPase [Sesbania bispinosa]|nr:putative dynein-related AAA-type ATPase [Sesbania bispinosa]
MGMMNDDATIENEKKNGEGSGKFRGVDKSNLGFRNSEKKGDVKSKKGGVKPPRGALVPFTLSIPATTSSLH